jgi:hypothetical protein
MKILHGHVGTDVRVQVDDNVTTNDESGRGLKWVHGFGYFAEYGDSTFSIEPDGTLHIYGDRSKPAHHSYKPDEWLWVGDEMDNGAFNTAHGTLESPTEGHG